MIILVAAAMAAGIHSGIPVRQADLGEPSFLSAENGWSAPLASGTGMVRVFVGRDEAQAGDWFERVRQSFSRLIPDYSFADQAAGDGVGVLLFRDGNVAVMVRSEGDALARAQSLRARIVDNALPLGTVTLLRVDDGWQVQAPGAVHVDVQGGGNTAWGAALVYTQKPTSVTVWDAFGRALVR